MNFVHDGGFRFLGADLAIGGQDEVENQIDIGFPLRHAEIVYGAVGVYRLRRLACRGVEFRNERVVYDERVEVHGDDTAEFFVHIPFHSIHFLVRHVDVRIGRHFRVEGHDLSARTVVVHHYVVNPDDTGIVLGKFVNIFNELGVGGRAEQKVDRFLGGFYARVEDKRGDENTRPTVDWHAPYPRHDRRYEHERGRDTVGKRVERRGFDCRGANGFRDFVIKEEQPHLDEYGRAEQN